MQLENLTPEEKLNYESLADDVCYKVGEHFLYVTECTDGYDYSLYDRNLTHLDGGVYDDTEITLTEAVNILAEDFKFKGAETLADRTAPMLDVTSFLDKVEELEIINNKSALADSEFSNVQNNSYAIYQLKNTDYTRDFRFEGLKFLEEKDILIDKLNFDTVYVAEFNELARDFHSSGKLNYLFTQFNVNHPSDFKGHSLSVGDVVALKENDVTTYHFVDSFGFKEIPFVGVIEKAQAFEQEVSNSVNIYETLSIVKNDPELLMNILSKDDFAKNELSSIISICNIKEELTSEMTYTDMSRLNSYCKDVWHKVDGSSFEKIKDFAVEAINEGLVTVDEIVTVPRNKFGIATLDDDNSILLELFPKENEITTNIKVDGHKGTWYIVDTEVIKNETYHLLEHETHGDMTANIIVDIEHNVILDDVWNGFSDLEEYLDDNYLLNAETDVEQNFNQIDGIINNLPPKEEKKPSILQSLKDKKDKDDKILSPKLKEHNNDER